MASDEVRIQNSALWASAADAMGWISELVDDRGLRRRTGSSSLTRTVEWKRKIGGLSGVNVSLPAGTYSDDTQLRLAVCRAIRSDGSFDVEAFAKIELPAWSTYCLGAGRGTKAAAANLAKRDVTWFSNFFSSSKGTDYVQAGGNGAAMRIQPHVWANVGELERGNYITNVVRDSLVTHGHMVGVCGAMFHARCLAHVFSNSDHSGPDEWQHFVDEFRDIEKVIRDDGLLSQFWLGAWEEISGRSLTQAIDEVIEKATTYIDFAKKVRRGSPDAYVTLLDSMECRGRYLGAGLNTAIAASYLAWAHPDVEVAVRQACNVLGSDTDTIGTMTGALAGALSDGPPVWILQDREYISQEARRMYLVASGQKNASFTYPDIAVWRAPQSQSDALGSVGDRIAVRGLGLARAIGEPIVSASSAWQWVRLDFGQTILCKSKVGKSMRIAEIQLPGRPMEGHRSKASARSAVVDRAQVSPDMPRSSGLFDKVERQSSNELFTSNNYTLDELTDRVIRSQFDPLVLGECFKLSVSGPGAIERSVAFASIIAKAITARRKKA